MHNIYNIISDIDILNNETKRMNCPECGGYKTFTISNNMGRLLWNCYKVSCSISGSKPVHLSIDDIKRTIRKEEKKAEQFVMPEFIVPNRNNSELARFASRYNLNADTFEMWHDVKDNRAVFPIQHDGIIVDAIGRSLKNKLPKWKRYGNSGLPYVRGHGKIAVVVEDCVSAVVVGSDVYVGVAVLGTSLSDIHKRYLSQFSTIVVALDPDALPKGLQMCKDLSSVVDTVRVIRLKDDLKYQHPNDIEKLTAIGDELNGTSTNT